MGAGGGDGGRGKRPVPPDGRPSVARAVRPLWTQIYLPNLLLATGQGAMLPVLVYAARQVHGSSAAAGALVAVNGFGTMAFDVPAGRIVARLGEWRSGSVAAVILVAGLAGCLFARSMATLALGVVVQAAGWSLWSLVRLAHLTRVAPVHARGRALSLFGGVMRAGTVLGPLLFVAAERGEDARVAFLVYLVCAVVGFTWLVLARDRDDEGGRETEQRVHPLRVLSEHRRGFATAGVGALGVSLLRGSRTAIIPLWASHIGLGSSRAASLFAFSSLVDLALFYPAGVASDRWGRRAVALPCLVLLSLGHVLVPFSHAYSTLFLVAFVLAVGNGMGAGIVMTLGADLTPEGGRASFLAVWRIFSDGGTAAGPLVDTAVIALGSLPLAGPVVGALGLAAAGVVARWLEEPAHLAHRRSARRAAPGGTPISELAPEGPSG